MKQLVCFGLLVAVVYCVATLELEKTEEDKDLSFSPKTRRKRAWEIVAGIAGALIGACICRL